MYDKDDISVIDCGAAADGLTDDTAAFHKAVALAEETGRTIHLPYGSYRLTDTVTLNKVTLFGHISGSWCADDGRLPTILVDHIKGPAFVLNSSSIAGVAIHCEKAFALAGEGAFPPAISTRTSGGRISNLKIHGAWDGIACDDAIEGRGANPGRFNVENVFMCQIHHCGLYCGATLDVNCIKNVEVWSPASKTFPVEGVGFHFKKNDGVHISDCFAFNAHIGFLFEEMLGRPDFNGGTLGWMTNCNVDYSGHGIVVRGSEPSEDGIMHYYPTQLSLVSGSYWCHGSALVVESGMCRINASSVELRTNGGPCVDVKGGQSIVLNGCHILRNPYDEDTRAVSISGGHRVVMSGCDVESARDGISIEEGARNVVINGCFITTKGEPIRNTSSARVQIDGCICDQQ